MKTLILHVRIIITLNDYIDMDIMYLLSVLKVMASDDHRFLSSSLYSSGALVAWDPAPFSADLTQVTFTSQPAGC